MFKCKGFRGDKGHSREEKTTNVTTIKYVLQMPRDPSWVSTEVQLTIKEQSSTVNYQRTTQRREKSSSEKTSLILRNNGYKHIININMDLWFRCRSHCPLCCHWFFLSFAGGFSSQHTFHRSPERSYCTHCRIPLFRASLICIPSINDHQSI